MNFRKFKVVIIASIMVLPFACQKEFLEISPKGALDGSVLANPEGINTLLIGAYSMVDGISANGFGWESASSNWVYGSIRGLEANKGTDSGDQPDINPIQTYSETATNPYLRVKWGACYEGISRVNEALKVLALAEANGSISTELANSYRLQARALRGYYHLEAYRVFEKIPYIDETTDLATVTNNEDPRPAIIADLQAAIALPNQMDQIGRFNGTVARVFLAKALMQMNRDYAGAKTHLDWVIANGSKPNGAPIGFDPKYGDVFDAGNRNGIEAVYTVQYSVNDGSGGWNGGWGEVLNFPYKPGGASPGGCCGFFQPSHDLANSFLTRDGLPMLDNSYNSAPLKTDQGLTPDAAYTPDTRELDPRIDWTIGRRGIPYLDWGPHTGSDWIRDQSYAGPYSPKKQVFKKSQEGQFTEVGNWTSGWTANGYRMIRYADVVLLLAECQIETNDLAGARANINAVRQRASNPDGFVKSDDGSPAANYNIALYPASGFPFDSQANARLALQMERKLELGMEGHRYFDLQRWGNVIPELTRMLSYEQTVLTSVYGGAALGPEDKNFPIPQTEIDLTAGRFTQNR